MWIEMALAPWHFSYLFFPYQYILFTPCQILRFWSFVMCGINHVMNPFHSPSLERARRDLLFRSGNKKGLECTLHPHTFLLWLSFSCDLSKLALSLTDFSGNYEFNQYKIPVSNLHWGCKDRIGRYVSIFSDINILKKMAFVYFTKLNNHIYCFVLFINLSPLLQELSAKRPSISWIKYRMI